MSVIVSKYQNGFIKSIKCEDFPEIIVEEQFIVSGLQLTINIQHGSHHLERCKDGYKFNLSIEGIQKGKLFSKPISAFDWTTIGDKTVKFLNGFLNVEDSTEPPKPQYSKIVEEIPIEPVLVEGKIVKSIIVEETVGSKANEVKPAQNTEIKPEIETKSTQKHDREINEFKDVVKTIFELFQSLDCSACIKLADGKEIDGKMCFNLNDKSKKQE